jgi:U3 small nucleolar RNA-associated protein MPP10
MRPTPLANLHIQGMDGQQIWNQLDLRTDVLCKVLKSVMGGEAPDGGLEEAYGEDIEAEDVEEDNDDLLGIGDSEADFEGAIVEHEGSEETDEEDEEEEVESSFSDEDFTDGPERLDMLRDPSPGPIGEFEPNETGSSKSKKQHARTTIHTKLDDGFFSLSEFNEETEASEARATSKGRLTSSDSEEEGLKEDIDLFAPVEQVHDPFDEGDLEEQNSGKLLLSRAPRSHNSTRPRILQ